MKILLITPPGSGQMTPAANLARTLLWRGHSVLWAVQPAGADRARRAGAAVTEIGPENLDFEDRDAYCPGHGETSGWDELVLTAKELIVRPTPRIVDDLRARFTRADFDVVLSDISSPAGRILGELWGLPWVCISTVSLSHVEEGVPPYGFEDELEAGRSIEEHRAGHEEIRAVFNQVRRRYGLAPVSHGWNDFFSDLLTFQVTTPDLEYPRRRYPTGLVFTGPLTDPTPDEALAPSMAEWLRMHERDGILYATLGTVFNKHSGLMDTLIAGVIASHVPAVISTGPGYRVPEALRCSIPARVKLVPWANHRALFPHVRAAVTHGGMSTTCDTVNFGLPTLHIPVGCDLPALSRKLARFGAGLRIPHHAATPKSIAEGIVTLMSSEPMRARVATLRRSFLAAGGAQAAARWLEWRVMNGAEQKR